METLHRLVQFARLEWWASVIWKFFLLLMIVLLLFSSRLPSVARALGQSIIEFKKGFKELENQSDDDKSA